LSDAYINGIPKRFQKPNKLIYFLNLRDSLQKVIKDLKLYDENSTNDVLNDICNESNVENNFDNLVKEILKENIICKYDKDFNLDKFIHMKRYLLLSSY
jgi:hypothetical protein